MTMPKAGSSPQCSAKKKNSATEPVELFILDRFWAERVKLSVFFPQARAGSGSRCSFNFRFRLAIDYVF
jgi:hypothetical protein